MYAIEKESWGKNQYSTKLRKFSSEKKFLLKNSRKKIFTYKKIGHAQFSNANKNETRSLAVEKSLHKTEDNTHLKVQETVKFKMAKTKQNLNFDKHLVVPEKRLIGVTIFRLYNTV